MARDSQDNAQALGTGESPLVSVIIPTLNEAENIRTCIRAARAGAGAEAVEIVVTDGGSTDRTIGTVPPDIRIVNAPRGRGAQMNCGAEAASGDVFLFCHADTLLPVGWHEAVVEAVARPGTSGGAFQRRYEPAIGLVIHLLNRAHNFGHWFFVHGDRCQFMSRATFEALGGFPIIPLMEDLEMSRALHRRGRIHMVPLRVVSSSRRLLEIGTLRQGLRSIWYCFRYIYLGASAADIAQAYRSSREERADTDAAEQPSASQGRQRSAGSQREYT